MRHGWKRTNADLEICSVVRHSWNQVVGNNSERVSVEGNAHLRINSGVDDAKSVSLSRGECDVVVRPATLGVLVRAVDQNVVASRGCTTKAAVEGTCSGLEGCDVVPIGDSICAEVNVIVSSGRPVDLNSADDAVAVLSREVRVKPCSAVFSSAEQVRLGVARGDCTYLYVSVVLKRSVSSRVRTYIQ